LSYIFCKIFVIIKKTEKKIEEKISHLDYYQKLINFNYYYNKLDFVKILNLTVNLIEEINFFNNIKNKM